MTGGEELPLIAASECHFTPK